MYAGQMWNPPSVGNNPGFMMEYLRMVVVLTVVVVIIKVTHLFTVDPYLLLPVPNQEYQRL